MMPPGDDLRCLDRLVSGRRSIRRFLPRQVPDDVVRDLVKSTQWAPSPSNSQPVRFLHLKDPQVIGRLKRSLDDGCARLLQQLSQKGGGAHLRNRINAYYRFAAVMCRAPVLLAVGTVSDYMGFSDRLADAGLGVGREQKAKDLGLSVGLAVQILLLKAHAMGIGSCVLTAPLVFCGNVEQALGLWGGDLHCFVALGYAAERPQAPERIALSELLQQR